MQIEINGRHFKICKRYVLLGSGLGASYVLSHMCGGSSGPQNVDQLWCLAGAISGAFYGLVIWVRILYGAYLRQDAVFDAVDDLRKDIAKDRCAPNLSRLFTAYETYKRGF